MRGRLSCHTAGAQGTLSTAMEQERTDGPGDAAAPHARHGLYLHIRGALRLVERADVVVRGVERRAALRVQLRLWQRLPEHMYR